jgi:hypothetical protein
MGFVVPATLPALSPYLQPPNSVRGDAVDSVLQRDRFLFATRRRLIFTGGNFTTTSTTYVTPYFFAAQTSAAVTGNLWLIIAGVDVDVKLDEFTVGGSVSASVSGGSFATDAQLLPGMTASTLLTCSLSVQTNAATGTLHGVYIVEEILAAGDLP